MHALKMNPKGGKTNYKITFKVEFLKIPHYTCGFVSLDIRYVWLTCDILAVSQILG